MEIWEGIKKLFKKDDSSVEVTESGNTSEGNSHLEAKAPLSPYLNPQQDNKIYLRDNEGNFINCEYCKKAIEQGQQKTFNGKKLHLSCYRKGMKEIRKHYGI